MKIAEQVSVTITSADSAHQGKTLLLDVEEFQPIEPSNYAWTAGWNCAVQVAGQVVWFFIDEAGVVWENNIEVGICPEQEEIYNQRLQAEMLVEEAFRQHELCTCGDPGDCMGRH
jgi:hypothetical protein